VYGILSAGAHRQKNPFGGALIQGIDTEIMNKLGRVTTSALHRPELSKLRAVTLYS